MKIQDLNRFTFWLPLVAVALFWILYLLPGSIAGFTEGTGPLDHIADTAFSKGILFWIFVFIPMTLLCLAWGYFGEWLARHYGWIYISAVVALLLGSFYPPVGTLASYAAILLSLQYISDYKDERYHFSAQALETIGYGFAVVVVVLFFGICSNWPLSSVFNLGWLICAITMLYWLTAAVCTRQARHWQSWILAVAIVALTLAAVLSGQMDANIFLPLLLATIVSVLSRLFGRSCAQS